MAKEDAIKSITDPKTGTPVFTREYDTMPYQVNLGGIMKARKNQKKRKQQEVIENY